MFSLTDTQAEEANGASDDPVFSLVISGLFKTEVPHAKHLLCDHRNPYFSENMIWCTDTSSLGMEMDY